MRDIAKSPAYQEGRAAEERRLAAKDRARAALDSHPNLADLAAEVSKQLGRDNARKQQILQRSPHLANGMDAAEFASMSSRELAMRELKGLGIDAGENDPEALLNAHHAGRAWARVKGGETAAGRLIGGASDAADAPTFLTRYLSGMDAADPVGGSFLNKYLEE